MENEHGRSRVFAQWLDSEEKIQASIGEGFILMDLPKVVNVKIGI